MPKFPAAILKRAKKIKLLATDVDGVLTGGEIIILNSGEEVKVWSVKDRLGFALLKASDLNIPMMWITARESEQVRLRAEEIGVRYLRQKCLDKWKAVEECMQTLHILPEEVAFVGDDYVDLKALQKAGLAICPPDSAELVLETAHYVTQAEGGRGVLRETIELLLQAQGKWKKAMDFFMKSLLVLILSLTIAACRQAAPKISTVEKPDQWIENFTITDTQGGVPVWILNSKVAQVYNTAQKVTLDDIRVQFMNVPKNSKGSSPEDLARVKRRQTQAARLTAPKGEVKLNNHALTVWGGVEVLTENGGKLYAQDLTYSTTQQKIVTESAVKIVKEDSVLLGEGMEATPDLSVVKVYRHKAWIHPQQIAEKK